MAMWNEIQPLQIFMFILFFPFRFTRQGDFSHQFIIKQHGTDQKSIQKDSNVTESYVLLEMNMLSILLLALGSLKNNAMQRYLPIKKIIVTLKNSTSREVSIITAHPRDANEKKTCAYTLLLRQNVFINIFPVINYIDNFALGYTLSIKQLSN
ncbi:CLUMA_CG011043, isoform A [Clunio marinus]|uniref:CLUMA_CG011043, isoform A n=1 Tax=Clunio marinus TaxID=568069 RepID=A0A1J1ID42_9DIPT|nr:CLUMA_CG011043, isoform A [Clunio marinus]